MSGQRRFGRLLVLVCAGTSISALPAPVQVSGQDVDVPLYDDLGDHRHPISTDVPEAQRYFDQGFRLTYAFNYNEAIESYREAAELDSACAMCWWGIAWASGPNINASMDSASGARAFTAIQKALERAEGATERERAYIEAMAARYGPDPTEGRVRRDTAYARAAVRVADRYPEDLDAQVLAAEALMLLSPWDYWYEDGTPKPGTSELLDRLRPITEQHRDHAGACHFYIHAVEKAHPRRAVPCADRIADLMPGAGHVVHMPAHVYIRVGRYIDAMEANQHAVHADESFIRDRRQKTAYTLALYPHNFHFLSFAASMAGQRETAMEAARQLADKVDRTMMREPGFGALQHYLVTPLRVMVRFGMWEEILAEPEPPRDLPYPLATWRYARGMAFARTGRPDRAAHEAERLRELLDHPDLAGVSVWDLNSARSLMSVARQVLAGEIAAARGDYDRAIAELGEGVRLETALTYDEPPPWHLPVRHVMGAVLLEAGQPAQAESVYRKALQRFPENGWALSGLIRALEAQGKNAEEARARFDEAWGTADVRLPGSRF